MHLLVFIIRIYHDDARSFERQRGDPHIRRFGLPKHYVAQFHGYGSVHRNLYYSKPRRCSCSQSILFHCRVILHVSAAFHTHHQEYIKLYLHPPVQVILSLKLPFSNVANFAINFISLQGHSTCFGCFPHPSSGVH